MTTRLISLPLIALAVLLNTQAGLAQKFEVASIRPNQSGSGSVTVGTSPGGRYSATNVSLKSVMQTAFGVRDFQIAGGPGWLGTDRYDISAKAATPLELNNEQLRPYLQALLAERFNLKFHGTTKELPVYELTVAKNGPRLTEHNGEGNTSSKITHESGKARVKAVRMSMVALADNLSGQLGRTVIDKSGLKGEYDFGLEWTMELNSEESFLTVVEQHLGLEGPSIFTALQDQLGLKLNSGKGPVEIISIDRLERPTAN